MTESSTVRDHLANERTQLAWLRTSANVVVVGLAVARFADGGEVTAASLVAGGVLILVGAVGVGYGTLRYRRAAAAIQRGDTEGISASLGPDRGGGGAAGGRARLDRRPARRCLSPVWDDRCRMQPSLLSRLRGRREITFAVLAVAASSFALLQSLIVPVLATIQVEFDTSQTTVTWVLTAYLLSASICTPLLGRIGDVVGKTRMLVIALVVLSLGSLAAALAPSIGWLIAARALQGVGGGVLPLSFGIIRDEFRERMTMALSVIASLDRGRLRRRDRGGRSDRRHVRLPGAVLAADGGHPGRRRGGAALRARVAGPDAGPAAGRPRPPAGRVAGRAAARAERGQRVGLDVGRGSSACSRSRWCWPPPGSRSSCGCRSR